MGLRNLSNLPKLTNLLKEDIRFEHLLTLKPPHTFYHAVIEISYMQCSTAVSDLNFGIVGKHMGFKARDSDASPSSIT